MVKPTAPARQKHSGLAALRPVGVAHCRDCHGELVVPDDEVADRWPAVNEAKLLAAFLETALLDVAWQHRRRLGLCAARVDRNAARDDARELVELALVGRRLARGDGIRGRG